MTKSYVKTLATVALLTSSAVAAHDGDAYTSRVDDHAPIGVMADHYHKTGEWMASARYMTMKMGNPISAMGPQEMTSHMVMAGMMYAPTDWVTLTAGTSFRDKTMKMAMNGETTTMSNSNMGDLGLNAIFPVYTTDNSRLLFKAGVSLPTGKIAAANDMDMRYSLMLQSGTGSYGFTPAVTYSQFNDGWSFGAQLKANIWLDDNSFGERAGDVWTGTTWGSYTIIDNFSISGRLSVESKDTTLTTTQASGDASETAMGYVGANYVFRNGALAGHRFAVEFGKRLAASRGDHNLEAAHVITIGWQLAW